MGYPVGPVYRMLVLKGQRLNECAKLSWPEVHGDHIIVPASRMKGKEGKVREHLVPLTTTAQEIIASLPRFKNGPYLFSLSAGKTPVAMSAAFNTDLDRRMCAPCGRWSVATARIIARSSWRLGSITIRAASFAAVCRRFVSRTMFAKQSLHIGRRSSSAPTTRVSVGDHRLVVDN